MPCPLGDLTTGATEQLTTGMNPLAQLTFRGAKRVRVFGTREKPLFLVADIGEVLEITNTRTLVSRLPATCRGCDVTITDVTSSPHRGRARKTQKMATVTEAGVYRLIFSSRKPEAEDFMACVTEEVLPTIRREGRFDIEEQARRMAFRLFLTEIPASYRQIFPDDWFEAILGVYGLEYVKAKTPSFVGKLINEYVYDALVDGLPDELKARRLECGRDYSKLHQFLVTEARVKLSEHLAATKALARNYAGQPDAFREAFARVFRGTNQLLLGFSPGRSSKKAKAA